MSEKRQRDTAFVQKLETAVVKHILLLCDKTSLGYI